MSQKIQILTLFLLVLQASLISCGVSTSKDSSSTTYKIQHIPLAPMQTQGFHINDGQVIAVPLSYTRSGNLIISANQCEGDPTAFAVVLQSDIFTIQKPLLPWSTIGNSILKTSLKVDADNGSQGSLYLLVKLIKVIDDQSYSYSEFRTSLATSSISPEKIFSVPSNFEVGWNWDATNGKLIGSWPVLETNSTFYNDLLYETSKSDKLSVTYNLIATTSTKITEGMAKCNLKVKGQTGLIEGVQEVSLPDSKNTISFELHPTEKIYHMTIVATVSKAYWNDNSRKSWEIQYLYPIVKYEVPAQYLSGAQEQITANKSRQEKVTEEHPVKVATNNASLETPTNSSQTHVNNASHQAPANLTVESTPTINIVGSNASNKPETHNTSNTSQQPSSANNTETQAKQNSTENTTANSTHEAKPNTTQEDASRPNATSSDEIVVGNATQESPKNNTVNNQSADNTTAKSQRSTPTKEAGKSQGLSSASIFLIVAVVVILLVAFAKIRQSRREQMRHAQKDKNRDYFENTSTYFELSAKRNKIQV